MTKQLQIMDEVIAEIMVNAFAPFAEMGEKYGITYSEENQFLTTKEN